MIDLTNWERATWWNLHPDRCQADFGPPQSSNGPKKWDEFEDLERDITYLEQFSENI